LLFGAVLIAAAILATGCLDNRTGDVGNKNIRPQYADDYEKNDLSMNGTYSSDESTYRTRFSNNRMSGQSVAGDRTRTGNRTESFEINERIAQQIAALPEVGDAYVAIRDRNAYVAITDERHVLSPYAANINSKLRDKISSKVKSLAPSVNNVYVSAHPEAIERLQWYTLASRAGQSAADFLPEFSSITVRRFSDAKIIR
jgi:YhcN/YlaJ family sporulation lipoprotein